MFSKLFFILISLIASNYALNLAGVPTVFTQSDEILSAISDDIANKLSKELLNYMRTGVESVSLKQISKELSAIHTQKDIFTKSISNLNAADQFFLCTTCRATLNVLVGAYRNEDGALNNDNHKNYTKIGTLELCRRLHISTDEVCDGLFEINYDIIYYIVQNSEADARTMCGILPISFCQVKQNQFNFTLAVNVTNAPDDNSKMDIPEKSDNDLKIVHITDIHYDPEYKAGTLAACAEPLCCRRGIDEGLEVTEENQAGYWSDYRDCDTPLYMIEDALDHIADKHKDAEYIYHTGDIVPHNVWTTTKDGNIDMIKQINNLLESKLSKVPIYSCVGNHEPHPSNVFGSGDVPETLNVTWLYEQLYESWSKWLPVETKATILKGGYYTVSPKSGFRIIALNNMDCYLFNWWIFHSGDVAIEQLTWLHNTLLAAEEAGEYVHILAHIPSGDSDCWSVWSREYNRIINRFRNIIGGIFNGHTHVDEFNVHVTNDGHAIGVSWNGGSLTTYSYKNPNYRIYAVERNSYQVVEAESWIFNLTEANENGKDVSPHWYSNYKFTEEFTKDLSPGGLNKLLGEMAENPELLQKYWEYKQTSSDPKLEAGCDKACLLRTICRLSTTSYDEKTRCNELKSILIENLPEVTTANPIEPTTKDPGDGAVSITSMSILTLISSFIIINYLI